MDGTIVRLPKMARIPFKWKVRKQGHTPVVPSRGLCGDHPRGSHAIVTCNPYRYIDHPDSLETELLVQHIKDLKVGRSIEQPLYNLTTHQRMKETKKVEPREIII